MANDLQMQLRGALDSLGAGRFLGAEGAEPEVTERQWSWVRDSVYRGVTSFSVYFLFSMAASLASTSPWCAAGLALANCGLMWLNRKEVTKISAEFRDMSKYSRWLVILLSVMAAIATPLIGVNAAGISVAKQSEYAIVAFFVVFSALMPLMHSLDRGMDRYFLTGSHGGVRAMVERETFKILLRGAYEELARRG